MKKIISILIISIILCSITFANTLDGSVLADTHITATRTIGEYKAYNNISVDNLHNFVFPNNSRVSIDMGLYNRIAFKTQILNFSQDNWYIMKVYLNNEKIYEKNMSTVETASINDDFIWINWSGTVTFEFMAVNKYGQECKDSYLILHQPVLYSSNAGAGKR